MADPIDTTAVRKIHRLAEAGDYDAGHNVCHECGENWPCAATRLSDEVDRLRRLCDGAAVRWWFPPPPHEPTCGEFGPCACDLDMEIKDD